MNLHVNLSESVRLAKIADTGLHWSPIIADQSYPKKKALIAVRRHRHPLNIDSYMSRSDLSIDDLLDFAAIIQTVYVWKFVISKLIRIKHLYSLTSAEQIELAEKYNRTELWALIVGTLPKTRAFDICVALAKTECWVEYIRRKDVYHNDMLRRGHVLSDKVVLAEVLCKKCMPAHRAYKFAQTFVGLGGVREYLLERVMEREDVREYLNSLV